ncbi:hypothetical protein VCHENC02_3642B, partial [Vibrio harveyi]
LNFSTASLNRDFTVPKGMSNNSATCWCGNSSRYTACKTSL